MELGLSFEIPNEYGSFLNSILEPVKCENYKWYIENDEIYLTLNDTLMEKWLFEEEIISGEEFKNLIKKKYYVIFAEIKAFPKEMDIERIGSHKEFLNSSCELMVLASDCSYFRVYCKDEVLLEELFINAENNGYKNIKYIIEDIKE